MNVIIIGDKKILFGKKKKLKKTKTTDYHKKFSYTAIAKMLEFFLYWQHIYYVFVDVLFNRQSTFLCSYAPLLAYRIYPIELEIKDTTDTARSASYLNLHLEIDSEGRLRTKPYDTEMISIFILWTVHFYVATSQQNLRMEFISQLIRYPSACVSYHDFLHKGLLQTRKLQNQGFLVVTLKHHFKSVTVATMTWLTRYGMSVSKMTRDMFYLS